MPFFPYDRSSLLTMENPYYVADLERFVMGAYKSDVEDGDVASEVTKILWKDPSDRCAVVSSKSAGLFCGEMEALWFLQRVAPQLKCEFWVHDGEPFKKNTPLFRLTGNPQLILAVERTLLNTLQRLSGIATLTAEFVKKAGRCPVAATRKTLYGRVDKRAVVVGGGVTHRLSLGDAPMFKSNHLELMDFDFENLVESFDHIVVNIPFITVEVTAACQAMDVLASIDSPLAHPLFLLFDNFDPYTLKAELGSLSKPKNVFFEASGNITLDTVSKYARTGVDVVSVGALTHSALPCDLSMNWGR